MEIFTDKFFRVYMVNIAQLKQACSTKTVRIAVLTMFFYMLIIRIVLPRNNRYINFYMIIHFPHKIFIVHLFAWQEFIAIR